jgi:hypothetical protein
VVSFLPFCVAFYLPHHDLNRELAELLGQVKPPTVSKEEIEKSGLEIVKPAVLEQYEKDGKVSSNCAEKVSPSTGVNTAVLSRIVSLAYSVSSVSTSMTRTTMSDFSVADMRSTKTVLISGFRQAGIIVPLVARG